MSSVGAPSQHRQPSRKGKKAWRKNVDVTELQDGLEEYREEVRTGGPLHEKTADEVFTVDTIGSKDITKKYNLGKPLKADEILAQRSAVPAVDSRKRADAPSGIYERASKRRRGDWVSKKDVQRLKQTINKVSHLPEDVDETKAFDLWNAPVEVRPEDKLEYVPKTKPKVAPATITRAPMALTASGKSVKPVPDPRAGSSYNPDYEEWNEAIIKEGDREVEAEKARLKAAEEEARRQALIEAAVEDETAYRTEDESAWEGFETENDDAATLKKKRPQRKTPVERNKAKRKKEAERLAKHERKMADRKKVGQEVARLVMEGALTQASADDALAAIDEIVSDASETGDDTKLRRRKFGTAVIPEKSLEIVLPDELQDSLRRLKPEGNLLQDRFRNLLVNGKVEARKPVLQPKKRRVKMTEKWAFKDFGIQV